MHTLGARIFEEWDFRVRTVDSERASMEYGLAGAGKEPEREKEQSDRLRYSCMCTLRPARRCRDSV